jgi:hypothetical protein
VKKILLILVAFQHISFKSKDKIIHIMNVSPQSENVGNVVHIKGNSLEGGVKLQSKFNSANNNDESEDEDFMALMNETKKKDRVAFTGNAGLPGGFQYNDNGDAKIPGSSNDFQSPAVSDNDFKYSDSEKHHSQEGSFKSLEEEKQHFLYKIQRLQNRFSGRRVSIETPLDELKYEFNRLMRQSELSASVKFQRRTLMATVSGIEYLNKSFNPLGLHLDGWSEQVMDSLEDFDQSFEQLHDKYQGTAEISPEWNILLMLLGSGFMFHLSNSLFKSVLPNVNDVARNNPDLMNQIASAMGKSMQEQQPQMHASNNSKLGASLAMQAMQQKLRPSNEEEEDENEIRGFEQASALARPVSTQLPPLARPVSAQVEESSEIDESDKSSELSMSEDGSGSEIRHISQPFQKRAAPPRKYGNAKKVKNSVNISL